MAVVYLTASPGKTEGAKVWKPGAVPGRGIDRKSTEALG